jgi:septal ring factor EnvC (AmiA/AmiB activator)
MREAERKRAAEAANTRARLDRLETQLILTQAELAKLNNQARELLTGVGALGRGMSVLEGRVVLDEGHLAQLGRKLDDVLARLGRRQTQLEHLIEQRDVRVLALLNALRTEVKNVSGTLGEQRAALDSLVQRYPAFMAADFQPRAAVARDVIRMADDTRSPWTPARILGYLATAVSIGKKYGPVTLNIFGLLAELAAGLL